MSLINEALKKAQHQRTGPADLPPMPGGSVGPRGGSGMPKGMMVLLVAGAFVVVVLSVVATVFFLNRAPSTKVAVASPVAPAPAASLPVPAPIETKAPSPVSQSTSSVAIAPVTIKIPLPVTPTVETPPAPAPAVASTTAPAPAATTAAATNPPAVPAAETPAAAPAAEGSLSDRIADYVDKLRVTGIRTSETGSKVLMNDKVYRANDIVNRALGLRLVKITADSLTFADASGATYVKNF
jgi:cytoskeletal protein RodZ